MLDQTSQYNLSFIQQITAVTQKITDLFPNEVTRGSSSCLRLYILRKTKTKKFFNAYSIRIFMSASISENILKPHKHFKA